MDDYYRQLEFVETILLKFRFNRMKMKLLKITTMFLYYIC